MNTNNKPKKIQLSLSKFLAQSGIASRRKVVDIIKSKVVRVNGAVINEPGFKVSEHDIICVNNAIVQSEKKIYVLLNKPKNCITTVSDEKDRYNVLDIFADVIKERIYPIGRLDRNTTGLLVLTNDGDLAQRLSHPSFEIEKIYHVRLNKSFTRKDMQAVREGVELEDGIICVDEAYYIPQQTKAYVGVVLHSGKYRVVRRMFEAFGYEVLKLDRVGYAGLTKTGLAVGAWRHLTQAEVTYLKNR